MRDEARSGGHAHAPPDLGLVREAMTVATKDKGGGKTSKKQSQTNLKQKRAAKKEKRNSKASARASI